MSGGAKRASTGQANDPLVVYEHYWSNEMFDNERYAVECSGLRSYCGRHVRFADGVRATRGDIAHERHVVARFGVEKLVVCSTELPCPILRLARLFKISFRL